MKKIVIGIDAGVSTGFAVWNREEKRFEEVCSMMLHEALFKVKKMKEEGVHLVVVVEDARLAVHGRRVEAHKAQGAGSVKRDAKIWEDFLKAEGIEHLMSRPNKALTKIDAASFKQYTGWKEQTNNHARDAAMMVLGW